MEKTNVYTVPNTPKFCQARRHQVFLETLVEDVGPTRESHIVLYVVDALVRLNASVKKWLEIVD